MTSDLSIVAARIRDFIRICAAEADFGTENFQPELREYYDIQFNGMALVLFALQFGHNEAYRKICEARGIFPSTVTHWTQIPAVPTSAFKELELSCLPEEMRRFVFHSSGTTGQQPSRHFHSFESLELYQTSLWPWFAAHLLPDQPPPSAIELMFLVPPQSLAPNSSLVSMFETIRRRFGAPESAFVGVVAPENDSPSGLGWNVNFEAGICRMRESVEKNRPMLLLGTAFSFVHLLDHLGAAGIRLQLPPGSRVMETGGYKGRSREMPKRELHAQIAERLGVAQSRIVCEYGMSELSSQAYDTQIQNNPIPTEGRRCFRFPPWARAHVISPETGSEVADGETGLLRIFDLANVFSLLAIQTEDLAIRRGAGFELIGRALRSESRGCSLMTTDV